MTNVPTGTVTLVFTDIEGSTRLLHTLGPAYEDALATHRGLLRQAFSSHAGIEVDTQGDALFYAFARARDALEAATVAQRALAHHDWPPQAQVRVRMGIHSGEPAVTPEGYVGADVHLAARICAAAHGAQVLVSDSTAHLLPPRLEGLSLRPLGDHRLKDIDHPVALHQLSGAGLEQHFPPPRTPSATHPTNLPARLEPLIGRDQELSTLTELLTTEEVYLVTLTGPGGTGKTRLALATGQAFLDSFPDGVFFVDLSATTDPDLVVPHIAHTLSLRETPGRSLTDTLTDHLAHKEMLLVLDNLEQVIAAAPDIASLLAGAPRLKVLATSREPLRVTAERVFSLAPLEVPSEDDHDPEELQRYPAVALFTERARQVKAGFSLTEDNAADIAAICRRLDGLPLALELAAARVNLLSPAALLSRLDHGLKVLTSGRRDAVRRQKTLKAAIEWSYNLLTEDEQTLLRRLGVFAGGFTLQAAEQVCDRGDLDTDVLDGLASLVDKSLVRTVEGDDDRFSQLETIREFAQETLEESGEAEDIRRVHAEFFRALAEEAEPHLIGADQKQWLDVLEIEHDNIRTALGWALESAPSEGSRIAGALVRFWDTRGYATEGRRWLRHALHHNELRTPARMRATLAAAILAEVQDDYESAASYGREALSLAREQGNIVDAARALISLGWVSFRQGDLEGASVAIEEALILGETADNPYVVRRALSSLAAVRSDQQRIDEAISLYQRSAEMAERSGDRRGLMTVLVNLGELHAFARESGRARKSLLRGLALAEEVNDPFHAAGALINLGIVALLEGRLRDGVAAFERALDVASKIGSTYLALGATDGLAAAVADEDPAMSARFFAASEALRKRARVPRFAGEQTLYQPWIDSVKGKLTHEEEVDVIEQVRDLQDVIRLVRTCDYGLL